MLHVNAFILHVDIEKVHVNIQRVELCQQFPLIIDTATLGVPERLW